MKIHFTKKEYKLLLDMISISTLVMSDSDKEDIEEYNILEQKILSYASNNGYEKYVQYSKTYDELFTTRKYEEESKYLDFVENYEEEYFWGELCRKLARRDLIKEKGLDYLENKSMMDWMKEELEIAEKYDDEFCESGIENLVIVKDNK